MGRERRRKNSEPRASLSNRLETRKLPATTSRLIYKRTCDLPLEPGSYEPEKKMKHTIMTMSVAALLALTLAVPAAGGKSERKGKSEREETQYEFDTGKNPRLSLSNLNGGARITGWDRNAIEVTATKITSGPREHLDDVKVKCDMGSDHLQIEVDYDDLFERDDDWDGDGVTVEFDIRVPRGIEIDAVELVNGSLEITDVTGDVEASSVNGGVTGKQLGGVVRLSTVNGDVSLSNVIGDDTIRLSSVNGSVTLTLPNKINAKISASTVHGDVHGDLGHGVTHAGSSMDAVIGTGGRRIELGTVNGDIKIRRAGGSDASDKKDRDSDDDSD